MNLIKPDDIPESVWEAIRGHVARLIIEERQECAAICRNAHDVNPIARMQLAVKILERKP